MDKDCSCENRDFFELSPEEYVILALVIAFIIGESLDTAKRAILGNFLLTVGENMVNLTPGAWEV